MLLAGGSSFQGALVGGWALVWFVSEIFVVAYARSKRLGAPGGTSRDRGSLVAIILSVGGALTATLVASAAGIGPTLATWVLVPGSVVVGVGILIRSWAILTLGREFSLVVRTTPDQKLITQGPYALVRHPAYTGILLTIIGFAVIVGNLVGLAAAASLVVPGFLYRIQVEEVALRNRFPSAYEGYARRTWRLLPGVY